ncbi:cell division protein PerM [Agromyces soli]
MRRTTVALLAALEAAVAALVGFGIALVPLMLLWAVHFGLALGLDVVFRAAADVWLLGHGVDLTVQLDAVTAARTGVPGAEAPFAITICLLGFALLTVLFGRRIGRRAAAAGSPVIGAAVAMFVAGAAGLTASLAAHHPAASTTSWQAVLLPAAIMGAGVAIGALSDVEVRDRVVDRLPAALSDEVLAHAARAWRIGTGAAFAVLGVAALLVCWAIASGYGTIAGLYQALGAGVDGGIAITVVELAALPNLVVWSASWLLGPGFALGTGSQVTPAGTLLGPVPGLPITGALPSDGSPLSALWLLVPVLAAFVGALLVERVAATGDEALHAAWWRPLVIGLGAGVLGGALMGLLAWWSGGAVGPGRLAEVGPNGWAVAGVAAATIAVGAVVGGYAARRRPNDGGGDGGRPGVGADDGATPAWAGAGPAIVTPDEDR